MQSKNNITAVIPAYSDINIINNSVISLATQWIPDNTFELEIIIVNDNVEKHGQYNYYLSDEFNKIKKPNINIRVIENTKNVGQGVSRNTGIKAAKNKWIVLCDEDDSYAPNAIYRFWEILCKEHKKGELKKPVALIAAPLYGFDKDMYRQLIPSNSIWVNSKLYNRDFLEKHNIWFPDGMNSHRSEDYPFIRCLDFAITHDNSYIRIDLPDDIDTFYWWIPNYNSRSRCDKHYGSLLAGYTMLSSVRIFNFFENFVAKYHLEKEEDEFLKHEILNMTCYSWYNFLWFLKDLAQGWEDCKSDYWEATKKGLEQLRKLLLPYWEEIVPSDIVDMQYQVKHMSDCRFIESWRGSFEHFVKNGDILLNYSFDEIKDYCKTLEFDAVNHEIHSSYVKAWEKRHLK
mgnify:CR=1 FL=1